MEEIGQTVIESPVDDETYNLLQSLTSKLEAIEAYRVYASDGGAAAGVFEQLAEEDVRHAQVLYEALRRRLLDRP